MKAFKRSILITLALTAPTANALDVETARKMCSLQSTALACSAYIRASVEGMQIAQAMTADKLGYDGYEINTICVRGEMVDIIQDMRGVLLHAPFDPKTPAMYAMYAAAKSLYPCGMPL